MMRKVVEVKVLNGHHLLLRFDDGVEGNVDLSFLVGKGVFSIWNEPSIFASVQIGEHGELQWGDQVDLCPDSLYLRVTGRSPVEETTDGQGSISHA